MFLRRLLAIGITTALWGSTAAAEPLNPLQEKVQGIPLAQFLGTAQDLGSWKLLNGNGDLRLLRVMSKPGVECGQDENHDDADRCPRYVLFVVVNGELADPTDFQVFPLPEALDWQLPKEFTPDTEHETIRIPLRACVMSRTPQGVGWTGVSYQLIVTERIGTETLFEFSASLERTPDESTACD